ncbi:MAG TPA: methyl-accepting chemotaxis protein, partial [Lachnospiraceae bacterium]|nr:methyl-accepting chemotaxis protein [Lachnospiraceae bacterium]
MKTDYLVQKMENFFDKRTVLLKNEANDVSALIGAEDQKGALQQYLIKQLENQKDDYGIIDVYVGYPDGTIDCGSGWIPDDPDWKANERSWYLLAEQAGGEIAYTDVYIDSDTKKPVVTIAIALNESGKTEGVLAADVSLSQLDELMSSEKIGNTGYPFVLDSDGRFLIHPTYEFNEEVEAADTIFNISNGTLVEVGNKLLSGEAELCKGSFNGVDKVYYAVQIEGTQFYLVASITYEEIMSGLNKILMHEGIIALLAILLSTFLLMFFIRRITGAIERNVMQLRKLSAGELGIGEEVIDSKRKDEIGDIARATVELESALRNIISEVDQAAVSLQTTSEKLEQVSAETTATTDGIERAVGDVARGALSQAQSTEEASRQSRIMGENIEDTVNAIQQLNSNSDKMIKSSTAAMDSLNELNTINEKTKTEINTIYDQTNETNEFA